MSRDHKWFFYRKLLTWILYLVGAILGIFLMYQIVGWFFDTTFERTSSKYESYKSQYTATPDSDPTLVDRNKWKKEKEDQSWNSDLLTKGLVHPIVAMTIAFILAIAIVGGIVVFRYSAKHQAFRE